MARNSSKKLNIDKEEMYNELVISMWEGEPTNRLVNMFYDMTEGLVGKFNYVIEEDARDAQAFAMEGLLSRYHKFDFNKKNPFSYYTSTIINLIINNYPKLKRDGVSIDAILSGMDTEN